jgi:hypothetical protein
VTPSLYDRSVEPFSLLAPGSLAYIRLAKGPLEEFAPALLPSGTASQVRPILDRTISANLALLADGKGYEAILVGSGYPFRAASMALAGNSAWKRERVGYRNAKAGLSISMPSPDVILAASGSLETLAGRLSTHGPTPMPPELSELCDREIVVWSPDPFRRLAKLLWGEAMDIPCKGVLLSAGRAGSTAGHEDGEDGEAEEPVYEATVVFLMEDSESARIYRTPARLATFALIHALSPEDAEALPRFGLSDNAIVSESFRIRSSAIAAALRALAQPSSPAAPAKD